MKACFTKMVKIAACSAVLALGTQAFAYTDKASAAQASPTQVINLGDYVNHYNNGSLGGILPDIHMAPGSVYIINNPIPFFWIWIHCTVSTTGTQPIFAKLISGAASANGISLNTTGITLNATNGMKLNVHAKPKSKIYLRNDGTAMVSATCSL